MPFDPEVISAIAEGLRSGVDSYRQERDYQDKKKRADFDDRMKQQQLNLQLKNSGWMKDPNSPSGLTADTGEGLLGAQDNNQGLAAAQGQQPQGLVGGQAQARPQGLSMSADVSRMTPKQLERYTKQQAAIAETNKANESTPGRRLLPAGEAKDLGDIRAAPGLINEMQSAIDQNAHMMGPLQGRLNALNPTNVDAQKFNTQLTLAAEKIGKSIHVNRLSDTEQSRVQAMLPKMSDTPEVAKARLETLRDYIKNHWDTQMGGLHDAGFDTSAFERRGLGFKPVGRGLVGQPQAPQDVPQGSLIMFNKATNERRAVPPHLLNEARQRGFEVVK